MALSERAGFWTAASVAGLALWASGAPTVVYPLYAEEWHLAALGDHGDLRDLPDRARAGAHRVRQPLRRDRPPGGHPDGTRRPRRGIGRVRPRPRPHLGVHRTRAHGRRRRALAEPRDGRDGRVRRTRRRAPRELGDDGGHCDRPRARDDRRGSARAVRAGAAAPELLGAHRGHGARRRVRLRPAAPHPRRGRRAVAPATAPDAPRGAAAFTAGTLGISAAYAMGAIFLALGAQIARDLVRSDNAFVDGAIISLSGVTIGVVATRARSRAARWRSRSDRCSRSSGSVCSSSPGSTTHCRPSSRRRSWPAPATASCSRAASDSSRRARPPTTAPPSSRPRTSWATSCRRSPRSARGARHDRRACSSRSSSGAPVILLLGVAALVVANMRRAPVVA